MRKCLDVANRVRHAATGVRTDARIWDANLAAEPRWPGWRTDMCAPVIAHFLEVVRTERTLHRRRILSPVLLPYSWYWKHIAVMTKGLDLKAITIPPRSVHVVVALG
jgi:hypothetical protein